MCARGPSRFGAKPSLLKWLVGELCRTREGGRGLRAGAEGGGAFAGARERLAYLRAKFLRVLGVGLEVESSEVVGRDDLDDLLLTAAPRGLEELPCR